MGFRRVKRVKSDYRIEWSSSRIDAANYCKMRYWLRYVDPLKPEPLRISAYAKGSLLHDLIEKFWEELGSEEEVAKKSSKKKYSNSEEFVKYAQGKWKRKINSSKKSNKPIDWNYDSEPWVILNTLPKICRPLFDMFIDEGPPLFQELEFKFFTNGKMLRGRIDDIRVKNGAVTIRDYKSGNPWMGEMKLDHDPQLTVYSVALGALCLQDRSIAEKLGVSQERAKQFLGNPVYVPEEFKLEFFMIEALSVDKSKVRTVPNTINETERTDNHFLEILKMIEGVQKDVDMNNIYPERGRKCDSCDMKGACAGRLETVATEVLVGKGGQLMMDFSVPLFMRKDEVREGPLSEAKQGRLPWRYKK